MNGGWRYRLAGIVGTVVLTVIIVALVNNAVVIEFAQRLPVFAHLPSDSPQGAELVFEILTATAVILAAFVPLYKPRPMRILDAVTLAQKRV